MAPSSLPARGQVLVHPLQGHPVGQCTALRGASTSTIWTIFRLPYGLSLWTILWGTSFIAVSVYTVKNYPRPLYSRYSRHL